MSKSVKIVTETGLSEEQTKRQALEIANDQGLDLVEMSVQDGISICKIMDYRKHLYDVKKKEKANQIKPKQMKDIKIKPNIGTHDLVIKANKVTELIEDGHKVKVSIIYRGREMSRIKEGKLLLETLLENTSVDVSVVMGPKIEGNAYIAILSK